MRHRTRSKSICYYLLNLVMYTLKEIIFTTVEYRERKDKEREEAVLYYWKIWNNR